MNIVLLAPYIIVRVNINLIHSHLFRITLNIVNLLVNWRHWPCVSEFLFLLQRNYRFFFMFVFSTTLLCLFVFGFCWVYIKRIMDTEQTSIWRAMLKTPASIVLIVYTFIAVWFVGGLTAFHLYLISTNQVRTCIPWAKNLFSCFKLLYSECFSAETFCSNSSINETSLNN